jgi:hypothetical protein
LGVLTTRSERRELGPRRSYLLLLLGTCRLVTISIANLPTALDDCIDVTREKEIRGTAEWARVGEACASASLGVLASTLVNDQLSYASYTNFVTIAARNIVVL